jgi:hypothetical protein
MPIDDDAIREKIELLQAKFVETREKSIEIGNTINELRAICEEFDNAEPPVAKPIIDRGTGTVITPARRQNIYDVKMGKADTLLG